MSEGTATAAFCSWEIACSSRLHDRSYIIRLHFSFEFDTQKPDLNFNFQHDSTVRSSDAGRQFHLFESADDARKMINLFILAFSRFSKRI